MTELAEIRRPLALFTEGIAGVALEVDSNERQGSEVLVVPEIIESFEDPDHNRRAFRLAVLEGVARRERGTDTFDSEVASDLFADLLSASNTTKPSFGTPLGRRNTSEVQRFAQLIPYSTFLVSVFETLERARLLAIIGRKYPGVRTDIVRGNEHLLRELRSGADDSFLMALRSWSYGSRTVLPKWTRDLADAVLDPEATVYRTMEVALMICAHIDVVLNDVRNLEIVPEEIGETSDKADAASAISDADGILGSEDELAAFAAYDLPEGPGTAFLGDLADEDYIDAFSGSIAGDEQQVANQWRSSAATDSTDGPSDGADFARTSGPQSARRMQDRTFRYPEWDYHIPGYRPDWCRLIERRVEGQTQDFMVGVRRDHSSLRAQIKRRLSAIRPEQRIRLHGTSDGDELSVDAVIASVIDRRSGQIPEDDVYIRRERAERDVAAAFLIDLSRSTDSPVTPPAAYVEPEMASGGTSDRYDPFGPGYWDVVDVTPTPIGRRVVDVSKEAVAVLCESLETLGDSHAIYGFSGRGREHVDFLVAKEFADRASARTWSALGAMEPMSYTRMGPSIRHTASKLAAQTARTKILLMISDGYPQDEGYGPSPSDAAYGLHDTAQALREAESAGITTFCITVDPAGHDYLRTMCPEERYLVIDDMGALTNELEKVYASLTLR